MNKPLRVMPRWLRVGRKALRKYWQLAGLMGAVLLTGCDPKLEEVDASVVGLTIQIATNLVIIQAGNATLVARKQDEGRVKEVVERLKKQNGEYL